MCRRKIAIFGCEEGVQSWCPKPEHEDQSWTTGSRAGLDLCFAGSSTSLLNDLLPRYVECDVFSLFPNAIFGHPDMPLLIPAVVRAL